MNLPLSIDLMPPSSLGSILVVDDEPSILAIASAILNTVSLIPLKAANGEEAIAVMEAEYEEGRTITTAIVDLTMPGGLSGFETMEALKKIDPNIKVIACSGFFQEGALELCRSIGFANILAKPYTPDSFISMIRRTANESNSRETAPRSQPETRPFPQDEQPEPSPDNSEPLPTKKTSLVRSALVRSLNSQRPSTPSESNSTDAAIEPVETTDATKDPVISNHAE